MKTSNTPRLCAGPQVVQQTPTKFWNIASVGEDSGEIVLYGDVVARQPVDWWTGEPEPGLYIAPESFMEDLAAVKGKSNITIKINSTGGDLYTGIAIHNAIKGLSGHKVVIVEGIAASAASVIACAGDEVQVYPGSMVMIHGVAGLLAAVQFIRRTGLETIRAHELALARRFYEGVRTVPGVTVYGDFSTWERAPVVSLNIGDYESSEAADELAETYDIATRAGAHCAPRMHRALGTEEQGAVRFSFGFYNTEQETDAAIRAVQELAAT